MNSSSLFLIGQDLFSTTKILLKLEKNNGIGGCTISFTCTKVFYRENGSSLPQLWNIQQDQYIFWYFYVKSWHLESRGSSEKNILWENRSLLWWFLKTVAFFTCLVAGRVEICDFQFFKMAAPTKSKQNKKV